MSQSRMMVQVKRTDGNVQAVGLDENQMLSVVRRQLSESNVMREIDFFLYKRAAVLRASEPTTRLEEILDDDLLLIGDPGQLPPPGTGDGYDQYLQLTASEKRAILNNVQVYRGLTFDKTNWTAAYDAFAFEDGYLPAATSPIDSVKTEDYCFTEVTRQFKQNTSAYTKLELSTPFVSAEAEYRWEKTQETTSRDVTEYLITRQLVNKVQLTMDAGSLVPTPGFSEAVRSAVKRGMDISSYHDLIQVLNSYGYYVAEEFMLGGIVMGSESTTIREYTQAESEKREFNVAFSAKYNGFGGGASGGGSDGSDTSISQTNKYKNMTLNIIGGIPGTANYSDWAKSLDKANTWRMTDITSFRPTLALLQDHDGATLTTAMRVIEDYHMMPTVANLAPPQLDMRAYHRRLQELTAIDWGG